MTAAAEPVLQAKSESSVELSPLMQALSVLVMDFVDERRHKRQGSPESYEQIQVREP